MPLPADPKAELQKAILNRSAIIVAGTGVSIAASNNHPQASWTGLLKSGLELLLKHNLISANDSAAHLHLLSGTPETVQFIATAQAITREMSPRMFREWLKGTIGGIKASNLEVLGVLEDIRQCGNILATTNYDGLLLEGHTDLSAITWKDKAAILSAYRSKETKHVCFLHGYWEAPESVILDERSYNEITRDQSYRDELAAIWRTSTWMYVGCGENGLSDPDIGLLLDLYGRCARNDGHWDFCLVRKADKDRLQRYFNEKELNICAVTFGENHGDLPGYLRSLLPVPVLPIATSVTPAATPITSTIPRPPLFYAEPDYIGSHKFVGRAAELQILTDWAAPADPTNLLLFEAIGGSGKSMLTWEWTQNHAFSARPIDTAWAGRFWYSFYERGAIMSDFCQRSLSYMTGRPLKDFARKKTAEMKDELLAQLHAKPWLLILDGLERVLVAYHRIDAAEVPDEEANFPTDKIANRNPCDAIRDEDTELLRALAAAAPSKILVSSRLTPRVFLNPSGQTIPGAKRITLPGLRPPDAEALLRSCGIEGNSADIQTYLTANCDNHPLIIGILGGLITNYLPARGNFDIWSSAANGGASLDLASLDLIQRRNHILHAAIGALSDSSRHLLSTLSLVPESVDYETLQAFNPYLPFKPEQPPRPLHPKNQDIWESLTKWQKIKKLRQYRFDKAENALARKVIEDEYRTIKLGPASEKLAAIVGDLEQRGLLQYDRQTRRYDIHPVVRSVASSSLSNQDEHRYRERVVDHFSQRAKNPYERAKTQEELRFGVILVRAMLQLGKTTKAVDELRRGLLNALLYSVEDYTQALTLLRPLFQHGWDRSPTTTQSSWLSQQASVALKNTGDLLLAQRASTASLYAALRNSKFNRAGSAIAGIGAALFHRNKLASMSRCYEIALELAKEHTAITGDQFSLRISINNCFKAFSTMGWWEHAEKMLRARNLVLCEHLRISDRPTYVKMELDRIISEMQKECLKYEDLQAVEQLVSAEGSRTSIRDLHRLRGDWWLAQCEWAHAAESYQEAVRLARERSLIDADSETGLALSKHHLGQLINPNDEIERLSQLRQPSYCRLAQLCLGLGYNESATNYALASYHWAWSDGEPYVHRYVLTKTNVLLQQMNVPIPNLPSYDIAKDEHFAWETDVHSAIEKLRKEKSRKMT